MTLVELCERAAEQGIKVVQLHQLRPAKIALIDEVDERLALVNEDGLPLFTIEEAAALLDQIETAGGFEVWQRGAPPSKPCGEHGARDHVSSAGPVKGSVSEPEELSELRKALRRLREPFCPLEETNADLRREIRIVVQQELLRHKLITSIIPFRGE